LRHGLSYLLLDVLKRIGGVDGETDKDNVRVGVRERTETVVILLTSSIPQGELDVLSVNLYIGDIVLEDGRNVDLDACVRTVVVSRESIDRRVVFTSGKVPFEKTLSQS
jgi:hypothetical protein